MATPLSTPLSTLAQNSPVSSCSFDYLTKSGYYDAVKPYNFAGVLDPKHESNRNNLMYTTQDGIKLKDLRGSEHLLSLETHGFEFLSHKPKANLIDPNEDDLQQYFEETAAFIKQHLNAEHVTSYVFRVRRKFRFKRGC